MEWASLLWIRRSNVDFWTTFEEDTKWTEKITPQYSKMRKHSKTKEKNSNKPRILGKWQWTVVSSITLACSNSAKAVKPKCTWVFQLLKQFLTERSLFWPNRHFYSPFIRNEIFFLKLCSMGFIGLTSCPWYSWYTHARLLWLKLLLGSRVSKFSKLACQLAKL